MRSALILVQALSEPAELLDERAQLRAQPRREIIAKAVGRRLLHIGRFRELQLHRVHVVRRAAVGARDGPALEAAVQHYAVVLYGSQKRLTHSRSARPAINAAEVEIGKLAVKKARQHRKDGVRVP